MFTPLNPGIIQGIRSGGFIKFFVMREWDFIAMHTAFTSVPHKIVYVKKGSWDHQRLLFDCIISVNDYSFVVENITIARDVPMSRAVEYMFLEMTIEAAENLAKSGKVFNNRRRLALTSNLPTFSEITSERNFAIRKRESSDYYRAVKTFEYEKEGMLKNEKSN